MSTQERENSCTGWQPISTAPADTPVLIHYKDEMGRDKVVRAIRFERFSVESWSDDEEAAEYDEENDRFTYVAGWWELIDNWDGYNSLHIHHQPVSWHEIPPLPLTDDAA